MRQNVKYMSNRQTYVKMSNTCQNDKYLSKSKMTP